MSVRPSRPKKSATTPALFEINRPSGGGKADPQFEALSRGPHLTGASSILKEPVRAQTASESVRVRVFEPQAKPAASKTKRPQAKPAAWRSHGLSAAKDGD